MTIVDSTVWVDYYRKRATPETVWLDRRLVSEPVGLADVILCEVLQGVRDDSQFESFRSELTKLPIFSMREDIAVAAAQNYRFLRKRGITVRTTIDCMIATFCIVEGAFPAAQRPGL